MPSLQWRVDLGEGDLFLFTGQNTFPVNTVSSNRSSKGDGFTSETESLYHNAACEEVFISLITVHAFTLCGTLVQARHWNHEDHSKAYEKHTRVIAVNDAESGELKHPGGNSLLFLTISTATTHAHQHTARVYTQHPLTKHQTYSNKKEGGLKTRVYPSFFCGV